MKRRSVAIVVFVCLLTASFVYLNKVFCTTNNFNNTFSDFKKLTKQTNVDVVFYGTSHSYTAFNPEVINHDCKTISYNLGSGAQQLPFTELLLTETKKRTSPELVVIEVYPKSLKKDFTEKDKGYQLYVLDKIPFYRKEKFIASIKYFNRQELLGVYSSAIRNHKKWRNVNYLDFNRLSQLDNFMYYHSGFFGRYEVMDSLKGLTYRDFKTKAFENNDSGLLIDPKIEKEIVGIIKTAKDISNQVLIVTAPELLSKYTWDKDFYDSLERICYQNNVRYLNLNIYYGDIGLTLKDFQDPSHLNIVGADKTSKYIASYINANYKLPSRSKEPIWDTLSSNYSNYLNDFITNNDAFFSKALEQPLLPNVLLKDIALKRRGDQYQVALNFHITEELLKDMDKYNLAFYIIPQEDNRHLVSEKNALKNNNFDAAYISLEKVIRKGFFNLNSKIENVEKIEFFLFDKKEYNGTLGEKIILEEVCFI